MQGVDLSRIVPVFMKKHELSLNASIVDKTCDFAVARTETLERQVTLTLGFRHKGPDFRLQGLGFKLQGLGFRV